MKSLKLLLVLAMFLSMSITSTLSSTSSPEQESLIESNDDAGDETYSDLPVTSDDQELTSLRGTSRILSQKYRDRTTCNIYPRVCRVKGSPGPDCCRKKCVNVSTDRLNCGKCGKKCKYSEFCCKGKCVNPLFDKKNCGGCNKKCKKGSSCVYGMCSYA